MAKEQPRGDKPQLSQVVNKDNLFAILPTQPDGRIIFPILQDWMLDQLPKGSGNNNNPVRWVDLARAVDGPGADSNSQAYKDAQADLKTRSKYNTRFEKYCSCFNMDQFLVALSNKVTMPTPAMAEPSELVSPVENRKDVNSNLILESYTKQELQRLDMLLGYLRDEMVGRFDLAKDDPYSQVLDKIVIGIQAGGEKEVSEFIGALCQCIRKYDKLKQDLVSFLDAISVLISQILMSYSNSKLISTASGAHALKENDVVKLRWLLDLTLYLAAGKNVLPRLELLLDDVAVSARKANLHPDSPVVNILDNVNLDGHFKDPNAMFLDEASLLPVGPDPDEKLTIKQVVKDLKVFLGSSVVSRDDSKNLSLLFLTLLGPDNAEYFVGEEDYAELERNINELIDLEIEAGRNPYVFVNSKELYPLADRLNELGLNMKFFKWSPTGKDEFVITLRIKVKLAELITLVSRNAS